MYRLYKRCNTEDYKLVYIASDDVRVTDWYTQLSGLLFADYCHSYPDLPTFLSTWPSAVLVTDETYDPFTFPQTHPELFL